MGCLINPAALAETKFNVINNSRGLPPVSIFPKTTMAFHQVMRFSRPLFQANMMFPPTSVNSAMPGSNLMFQPNSETGNGPSNIMYPPSFLHAPAILSNVMGGNQPQQSGQSNSEAGSETNMFSPGRQESQPSSQGSEATNERADNNVDSKKEFDRHC